MREFIEFDGEHDYKSPLAIEDAVTLLTSDFELRLFGLICAAYQIPKPTDDYIVSVDSGSNVHFLGVQGAQATVRYLFRAKA